MQLTEAPEGKSSLQQQLNEAEKRAQEAEVSAQDAQATLARTLLDAARVEAVVTARIKAQSEAEIEALRAELKALKHAGTNRGAAPGDARAPKAVADDDGARREAKPLGEPMPQPLPVAEHVPQNAGHRGVTLKEWDRPFEDDETPHMRPAAGFVPPPQWEVPTPARVALLLAVAVAGVVTSYTMTASWLDDRGAAPSVTAMAGAVAGLVRADARPAASGSASVVSASDANWLLYMPVERTSLVRYLAGNAWPTIQIAEKR
jgi:hypothetical protein